MLATVVVFTASEALPPARWHSSHAAPGLPSHNQTANPVFASLWLWGLEMVIQPLGASISHKVGILSSLPQGAGEN